MVRWVAGPAITSRGQGHEDPAENVLVPTSPPIRPRSAEQGGRAKASERLKKLFRRAPLRPQEEGRV